MANMDLDIAVAQLSGIRQQAYKAVADGQLPEDCRDLFIAEIFRSVLRLSEAEAMVQLQRELRQADADEAVSRSLGAKIIRPQ